MAGSEPDHKRITERISRRTLRFIARDLARENRSLYSKDSTRNRRCEVRGAGTGRVSALRRDDTNIARPPWQTTGGGNTKWHLRSNISFAAVSWCRNFAN